MEYRIGVEKADDGTWYGYVTSRKNGKNIWRTSQMYKTKRGALNAAEKLSEALGYGSNMVEQPRD